MKKKGFTLIEILVVIAILAILVVMLIPNVLNSFNKSKRGTFKNEIIAIYTKAESQYVMDAAKKETVIAYANIGGLSCANELDLSGRDSVSYYIEFDENGNMTRFYAYDGTFQFQLEGSEIKKTDIKDIEDYNNLDITTFIDENICTASSNPPGGGGGGGNPGGDTPGGLEASEMAWLDDGSVVNSKIKSLANGTTVSVNTADTMIKKILRSTALPSDFTPTDSNTISSADSAEPIYIYWDSTGGNMYYYTRSNKIYFKNGRNLFSKFEGLTYVELSTFDTTQTTDMFSMFYDCLSLASLDLSSFNTSNVIYMGWMFYNCKNLTSLNLSNFNTSNVISMYNMFQNCENLTSLDISHFDTSNVTDMSKMFFNCKSLRMLNLSTFNTSSVTSMNAMFEDCQNLNVLNLSSFNTSNVTDMSYMFYDCNNLINLNISNFNTLKVTDMSGMFINCTSLITLNLSSFNTSNVTNMESMFLHCSGLTTLDLSSFNTSNVTNMSSMFYGCSNLKTIYVSNLWNTSSVTNSNSMFSGSTKLVGGVGTTFDSSYIDKTYAKIDIPNTNGYLTDKNTAYLDTGKNVNSKMKTLANGSSQDELSIDIKIKSIQRSTSLPSGFTATAANTISLGCSGSPVYIYWNSTSGTMYYYTTATKIYLNTNSSYLYSSLQEMTSVSFELLDTSAVESMNSMFLFCKKLTSLDLRSFNTSNATSMTAMFFGCELITSINLSSFNTSKVTTMCGMFEYCYKLASLNLSTFNTSNVTDMSVMFGFCSSLTSLDLSNFNTSQVTTMSMMFYNSGITSLNLSSFNTSNVKNMQEMFFGCEALTSLNLSSFNTSNVTNMEDMFYNCQSLTTLNLSSFNTSKVTNMNNMFTTCSNLTTIYVSSSWSTSAVTASNNMFGNCTKIKGGNGTTYDATHIDKLYARIDKTGTPGYLTSTTGTTLTASFDANGADSIGYTYKTCNTTTGSCTVQTPSITRSGYTIVGWSTSSNGTSGITPGNSVTISSNTTYYAITSKILTITFNKNTAYAQTPKNGTQTTAGSVTQSCTMYNTRNYCMITSPTIVPSSGYEVVGYNTNSGATTSTWSHNTTASVYFSTTYYAIVKSTATYLLDLSSIGITSLNYNSSDVRINVHAYTKTPVSGYNYYDYNYQYLITSGSSCPSSGYSTSSSDNYTFNLSGYTVGSTYRICARTVNTAGTVMGNIVSTLFTPKAPQLDTGYNVNTKLKQLVSGVSASTKISIASFDISALPSGFTPSSDNTVTINNTIPVYIYYNSSIKVLGFYSVSSTVYMNQDSSGMFENITNLQSVSLNTFKTNYNNTDFSSMFMGCNSLTGVNLPSVDMTKVTNMSYMFSMCKSLVDQNMIVLGNKVNNQYNTSNVTSMFSMFNGCTGLTTFNLYVFNTSNVTNMSYMFQGCSNLTTVNFINSSTSTYTDASKVTNMASMFQDCSSLSEINISYLNTYYVTNFKSMFEGCSSLRTIYATGRLVEASSASTTYMFEGCSSLVGGRGTTWNYTHNYRDYAKVDEAGSPGYFTQW